MNVLLLLVFIGLICGALGFVGAIADRLLAAEYLDEEERIKWR